MAQIDYTIYDKEVLIKGIPKEKLYGKSVEDILKNLYDSIGAKGTIDSDGIEVPPYRSRSLISLYQIIKTYRPTTTVEEVVKAIVTTVFANNKRLYPGFCGEIERCNLFFSSIRNYDPYDINPHPFCNYEEIMLFDYDYYFQNTGGYNDINDDYREYGITRDDRDTWPFYFYKAGITEENFISMFNK